MQATPVVLSMSSFVDSILVSALLRTQFSTKRGKLQKDLLPVFDFFQQPSCKTLFNFLS